MRLLETLIPSVLLLAFVTALPAQENSENQDTFLLTGASFASPNNGWFEVGCQLTGAIPLNRAVGGEAIAGEKFGWHPENGQDSYIQRRMGAIFADTMRKIFPLI